MFTPIKIDGPSAPGPKITPCLMVKGPLKPRRLLKPCRMDLFRAYREHFYIDIEKAAKVTAKEGRHGPYFAKLTAPDRAHPESGVPKEEAA
jgi:hypothetical protein